MRDCTEAAEGLPYDRFVITLTETLFREEFAMKTRCACLALCLCFPPVLAAAAETAPAGVVTPAATAGGTKAAAPAPGAASAAPTEPAPAAKEAESSLKPIAVGPFTLDTKSFGQKADTVTISGEISGGKVCKQLTADFSLRNPVQPQDVIVRETIEDYDPKTPRPFERTAAAINDIRAWKSWQMAYVSLQCMNDGGMTRYTAQPNQTK